MFSDRINRIDLISFHGFQMKPRKRNSASAEKRVEESTMHAVSIALREKARIPRSEKRGWMVNVGLGQRRLFC